MTKKALITGVTGQDGSYLAEFLLEKGYEVFGTTRVTVTPNTANIKDALDLGLKLVRADMQDSESLTRAIEVSEPDEVYNLAAVSYAPASWEAPAITLDVNAAGVARLLEAVRRTKKDARVYQASTSEMFGATDTRTQNESTPFRPVHPYGAAKVAGHWAAVTFREQYGMFVCCGILFNHESPRRPEHFVTRKITSFVARAADMRTGGEKLKLWTLDTVRDWGFAGDYVKAMWAMLQRGQPSDYVVGTGIGHTVGDFAEKAFSRAGLDHRKYVALEPPSWFKVDMRSSFIANASKAHGQLFWEPETSFEGLVNMMVDSDLKAVHDLRYHGKS